MSFCTHLLLKEESKQAPACTCDYFSTLVSSFEDTSFLWPWKHLEKAGVKWQEFRTGAALGRRETLPSPPAKLWNLWLKQSRNRQGRQWTPHSGFIQAGLQQEQHWGCSGFAGGIPTLLHQFGKARPEEKIWHYTHQSRHHLQCFTDE